jgi:hypothetical protein
MKAFSKCCREINRKKQGFPGLEKQAGMQARIEQLKKILFNLQNYDADEIQTPSLIKTR